MAFALVSEFIGLLPKIDLCVPLTLDILLLLLLARECPSVLLCNGFVLIKYLPGNWGAGGMVVGFVVCTLNSPLLMDEFSEKKLLGLNFTRVCVCVDVGFSLYIDAISSCGDEIASRQDCIGHLQALPATGAANAAI